MLGRDVRRFVSRTSVFQANDIFALAVGVFSTEKLHASYVMSEKLTRLVAMVRTKTFEADPRVFSFPIGAGEKVD